MSPFRKFIKQFSHFFTGSILSQLFSFVTFPILTRVLTKEQYGMMGLVTTTMLFAIAIAKVGLSDGIIRFYKEYSSANEKLEVFSSTVLTRTTALSALATLLYVTLLLIGRGYLKLNEIYTACFLIMAFDLFITPFNITVIYFLRVTDKTIFMNVIILIGKVITTGLSLFFLLYVFKVFYGYFIGVVLADVIVSAVLFHWFFKHYRCNPRMVSKELNVNFMKFGVPLFLSELCFLLMSYADRYLIVWYLGKEALGLYSVGYNVAMYIGNIIMFSISYAIVPIYVEIYGREGREKTEAFLKKGLQYIFVAIIPMWFGYAAISKELFIVFASEKYAMAANFSPLILFGYFCLCVNTIFNAGLYLKKRTIVSFGITLSAIILNIGLNLMLLRRFGIASAAVVAAASCMVSLILTIWISNKFVTVRVELKSFIYYLSVSVLMYLVISEIGTPRAWMNLVLKIIIGAFIIILAVIYKEYGNLKSIMDGYRLKAA
ncbi:MAG TPA: oligosaccharide flippase family protein [Syntrophales bacterium]|nr:oligosaccharide flippase family protein [Syntrophales bacterium]